jgi:hypothetical protein
LSATKVHPAQRSALSFLWFPVLFAIVLPITLLTAFHRQNPHHMPIAAVGTSSQLRTLAVELEHINPTGFRVIPTASPSTAAAEVRNRSVAAAYVAGSPSASLYVATAASFIRASYLEGVLGRIAAETRTAPPKAINVVPLRDGDSGTGVFFFLFPLMMVGVITVIVLLQTPWGIIRRVGVIAGVGAVATLAAYITAVELNVLPGKPLLIPYAFLLTQVYGLLLVGAAKLLRQFFLPASMTFALILSVPSAGGTVPPDLLPPLFRDLSYVMPLAQGVRFTRSVAYFHSASLLAPTLVLVAWAIVAALLIAAARVEEIRV